MVTAFHGRGKHDGAGDHKTEMAAVQWKENHLYFAWKVKNVRAYMGVMSIAWEISCSWRMYDNDNTVISVFKKNLNVGLHSYITWAQLC